MGLFSFGGSKQKQSSKSDSETYVDPSQQPHLNNIRNQAMNLSMGMPTEGLAGINPNLRNALDNQNAGGNMISGAGAGLMTQGSGLLQGSDQALNYSTGALNQNPGGMQNQAFAAGNQYAAGAGQAGIAQGGGANHNMANQMAGNASQAANASMGAAQNSGFDQANLGKYINNDVLSGQIDAASRDISRNLNENQLTGIASNAAGSGNSGSSRAGVAAGIALRGAGDRMGDIASQMRGNAYQQAMGVESNRASQNAQFQQGANQANAGFQQQGNQFNAGAQNQLRSQGYRQGASQLESNLGRQQQGNQFNTGQSNNARDFGSTMGQNDYNSNQQNQQFGADMSARMGQQGVNNMQAGMNMFGQGNQMQRDSGQYDRDYQQQQYNQQYRQGMAPYQGLQFYNEMVGGPNNLSRSSSSSKGKSGSVSFGFGEA